MIETIRLSISSSSITGKLAYFYCDGASAQGQDDIASDEYLLRCLLRQLSLSANRDRISKMVSKEYRKNHVGALSRQRTMELLQDVVNKADETIIVVDGLDECSEDVQLSLIEAVTSLSAQCRSSLHLFISSCPTIFIGDLLKDHDPWEVDTAGNNTDDIYTFVVATAKRAAPTPGLRGRYWSESESQEDAVIQKIFENAGGMFRSVDMAFKYLHDARHYSAMTWRLGQLSQLKDVSDLFDKIYEDMTWRLEPPFRPVIKTLLHFILFGLSPGGHYELPRGSGNYAHIIDACNFAATSDIARPSLRMEDVLAMCPILLLSRGSSSVTKRVRLITRSLRLSKRLLRLPKRIVRLATRRVTLMTRRVRLATTLFLKWSHFDSPIFLYGVAPREAFGSVLSH